MCYPVTCTVCGKTTWSGCGAHVDDVMRAVPEDQQCPGHEGEQSSSGGFFGRMFSR
jgi:hypothetical protein